jgi:hypothetical protein
LRFGELERDRRVVRGRLRGVVGGSAFGDGNDVAGGDNGVDGAAGVAVGVAVGDEGAVAAGGGCCGGATVLMFVPWGAGGVWGGQGLGGGGGVKFGRGGGLREV